MSQVTIPKEMHEKMIEKLRQQYKREFGDSDAVVTFSRDEMIEKYAKDIVFWKVRTPSIKPGSVTLPIICAHAICTNAEKQMQSLAEQKKIWTEVETLVEKMMEERFPSPIKEILTSD